MHAPCERIAKGAFSAVHVIFLILDSSTKCNVSKTGGSRGADHTGKRSRNFIFQNLPVDVRGTALMNS